MLLVYLETLRPVNITFFFKLVFNLCVQLFTILDFENVFIYFIYFVFFLYLFNCFFIFIYRFIMLIMLF